MKTLTDRGAGARILLILMCLFLVVGCGGRSLSEDFDEQEVKDAAEKVITLINEKDAEGLKDMSTVAVREALTDDVLAQVFEAIGEGGAFLEIEDMSVGGTTDDATEEEFAVVVVKAKYEIKTFTYTISFTKQMKLAGLYYK